MSKENIVMNKKSIEIQNVKNFRDCGGYQVEPDKLIRTGILYRSGDLSRITPEGIQYLDSLRVKTIFDLRSYPEIERSGIIHIPENSNLKRIHIPVFEQQDTSPIGLAKRWSIYARGVDGYVEAYMAMLENPIPFSTIMRHIGTSDGSSIIHCTAGKDRTGVAVMLILALCGVSDSDICQDYAITEKVLKLTPMRKYNLSMITGNILGPKDIDMLLSSPAEAMAKVLQELRSKYGSVEQYSKSILGLTDLEINALRSRLVMKMRTKL